MVAYRSEYRVGAVETSVASVPRSEIEIWKKNFRPKNKNGRILFKELCRCR